MIEVSSCAGRVVLSRALGDTTDTRELTPSLSAKMESRHYDQIALLVLFGCAGAAPTLCARRSVVGVSDREFFVVHQDRKYRVRAPDDAADACAVVHRRGAVLAIPLAALGDISVTDSDEDADALLLALAQFERPTATLN